MTVHKISDFAGSDWAQVLLGFAAMSKGDTLDFENGTFEVFSGTQQYFPSGMTYKNGTFTRPDAQGSFHRVVRTASATNDGDTTYFINCHVDGNKAGQGYGSVFTVDIQQQHGFFSHSDGNETVYWYKCTSQNNHGDGFTAAAGATAIANKCTSLGDLRSAFVLGSANGCTMTLKNCSSTDQKIDIETEPQTSNNHVTILNCTVTNIQIGMGSNSSAYVSGLTTTAAILDVLWVYAYSTADDTTVTIEDSDFSSGIGCTISSTSNFTMRNSVSPGFIITPVGGGGKDETDIPRVRYEWDNVRFTTTERPGNQEAYLNHPTDNGVIPYIENPPTSHLEWHVHNCTFENEVSGGYPIRMYGGDLYVNNNRHKNEYLARILGIGTVGAVYADGVLDVEETSGVLEYNPTPVLWGERVSAEKRATQPGVKHGFRPYSR